MKILINFLKGILIGIALILFITIVAGVSIWLSNVILDNIFNGIYAAPMYKFTLSLVLVVCLLLGTVRAIPE